jgi:hypothetical protein
LCLRLFGRTNASDALISCALVASWPWLVEAVLALTQPRWALTSAKSLVWFAAFTTLVLGTLASVWRAWHLFTVEAAPAIDEFIADSPEADELRDWFRSRVEPRRQIIAGALATVAAVWLFHSIVPALRPALEIRTMSYIVVAWTAAIAGVSLYAGFLVAHLLFKLARCTQVNYVWHAPATTPVITAGCNGFGFAAIGGIAAMVYTEAMALGVPNRTSDALLRYLAVIFPVVGALGVLYIAVLPFYVMWVMVKKEQRRVMAELERQMRALPGGPGSPEYQWRLEAYRHLSTSPKLPISTASVVEYAAVFLSVLLAYIVQHFSNTPPRS